MNLNVDNLNLLVEDIIKESVSDKVWHYTRPTSMLDILKTNKINLTPSFGMSADKALNYNKNFSLSLTTTKNPNIGFNSGYNKTDRVRIEFDGRELNYNFKSKHVDYWQYPRTKDFTSGNGSSYDEMEERIISDKSEIKPITRYIKAIEVFIEVGNNRFIQTYKDVKKYADELNIPCYFYVTNKDFSYSITKNAVDINNYESREVDDDYKISDEHEKTYSLIYSSEIAALISYKDDNLKNKILDYSKQLGLDSTNFGERIDKRMDTLRWNYLSYFNDVRARDLELSTQSTIQNNRASTDKLVRYVIWLLGSDMKKNKCNSITEYIRYKVYIGKKTQQQFASDLSNGFEKKINLTYDKYIQELNENRFETIDGDYYEGNITRVVPDVKKELDRIIYQVKEYVKEWLTTDDNMFYGKFKVASVNVKDVLKLSQNERDYEFEKDVIDYHTNYSQRLDSNDIYRVINYTMYEALDEYLIPEIDKVREQNERQWSS